MKNSLKIFKLMMVAVLILSTTAVFAQPPTLPEGEPSEVPIDGGLSLLVAAGVGYAVKRKKDQASKNVVGK
jgi:hypothetical protein